MALALGAGIAAGAAGRVLLHRRLRGMHADGGAARRGERQGLLEEGSDTHTSAQQSEANSRRARISRVLRERLGVQSRTVKMQAIAALPARLAHKLGSGAGGPRALGELELQPLGLADGARRAAGLPHQAVQAWVSTGAGMAAPAHQWQLDTTSLQLTSTELEVGWAERGSLPEYG